VLIEASSGGSHGDSKVPGQPLHSQWIGLSENLEETMVFPLNRGVLQIFNHFWGAAWLVSLFKHFSSLGVQKEDSHAICNLFISIHSSINNGLGKMKTEHR
jgi:hypothetical protein